MPTFTKILEKSKFYKHGEVLYSKFSSINYLQISKISVPEFILDASSIYSGICDHKPIPPNLIPSISYVGMV